MKQRHVPRLIASLAATFLGLALSGLQAQPVYRSVGPDGRVTFSDKPPPAAKAVAPAPAAEGGGTAALPYELRQVASRYPVTLYTGDNCTPCGSGRAYLTGRGVPFSEKTVTTPDDQEALQRLSGGNGLPLLTIGAQQLKGFSDAEWGQFLDAAGYPKTSQLPRGYRAPAATPLVTLQRPAEAAAAPEAAASAPARAAPATQAPANPAGIRF
ncbi:glutaredoxin family protein [Ramlibacter sp. 2FC]|uniref:glutaredoxin family protein n=1 Tax=Ramlibacter sp. 2FC TaxID=2502188 RepID=UPI0010F9F6BD|nr:glutaredoxin family protein [Ramlibacter sp. 2FC]